MKRLLLLTLLTALMSVTALAYRLDYKMSEQGINMIKTHEGCVLTPYYDGTSWAIGYGHHQGITQWTKPITQAQADKYLAEDILWINKELSLHIIPDVFGGKQVYIPQTLLDAIGDMIFRKGATTFRNSEVYTTLKRCRIDRYHYILQEDLRFLCSKIRNYQVTKEAVRIRNQHLSDCILTGEYFIRKVNDRVYV